MNIDIYAGLRPEQREKILRKDRKIVGDEQRLLSCSAACINNSKNGEEAKERLQRVLLEQTRAWQATSSGTAGALIHRLLGKGFLQDLPSFEVVRSSAEPYNDNKSYKDQEYITVVSEGDIARINVKFVYLSLTSEFIREYGYKEPYEVLRSLHGSKKTEDVACTWNLQVSGSFLQTRLAELQKELIFLDGLMD